MRVEDFKLYDKIDQMRIVYEIGTKVDEILSDNKVFELFQLFDFYIELESNQSNRAFSKVRAFEEDSSLLEQYLNNIPINI